MKNASGRTCDSEPEYNSGKDVSIKAQFGSCSSDSCSDRNPSSSSLECPECVQRCDNYVVDSNHSTCGSSENHECSDNTSYDSNVFWGGAPDQLCTDLSSSISELSCHKDICECLTCQNENRDENSGKLCRKYCDNKNSTSSLNLSELSGCDTICSAENDSNFSTCDSCQSVDCLLNLSEISGLTADDSSDTSSSSHVIDNFHCCHACNHENFQNESLTNISLKTNTLPKRKKYSSTLTRGRTYGFVQCANCKSHSVEEQLTHLKMSNCIHKQVQFGKLLQTSILNEHSQPTNHDRKKQSYNHNTQGDIDKLLQGNNELHIAPRTLTREKSSLKNLTGGLLPNFRLSRSCDILPTVRNNVDQNGEHIIYKQPKHITKDSVVKATLQGNYIEFRKRFHVLIHLTVISYGSGCLTQLSW